jgi:hypothetical protein
MKDADNPDTSGDGMEMDPVLTVDAKAYQALCVAVRKWWDYKKPLEWTLAMHIEQPGINCFNATEADLAARVAAMVKAEEQKKKAV